MRLALIAPLIPGVNDRPEQVSKIVEIATEAGAASIGCVGLHLRREVREIWFEWLREHRPDLVPRYEELYARGAYLPSEERERLAALTKRSGSPGRGRFRGRDPAPEKRPAPKRREPSQARLF